MPATVTSPKEIVEVIKDYASIYPNFKLTPQALKMYARLLQDCKVEKIRKAMDHCAKHNKYFPTVAEIREIAAIREPVYFGTPEYEEQQRREEEELQRILATAERFD